MKEKNQNNNLNENNNNLVKSNGMLKVALVLAIITITASFALAVTNLLTEPFIEDVKKDRLNEGLKKVVTNADEFKEMTGGVYSALKDGKKIAEIRTIYAKGYNDNIKMLVGYSLDGNKVIGVHILEHVETPGLGARVTEVNPGEDSAWFQDQFKGLDLEDIKLKKQGGKVDAITAATVTSKAVTEAIAN